MDIDIRRNTFVVLMFSLLIQLFMLAMLTLEIKNPPRIQQASGAAIQMMNYIEMPPNK